ncbi:hypothetical protein MRX96_053981 [Rhipicephalus microplus]
MSGRKRFSLSDDIALVKEVLYVNPFLDPARWLKIADRLSEVLGSSGTEEEQSELEDLLQQAADIARECGYTPPPSTARQLAERDGIKKKPQETRSPARQRNVASTTGKKMPWRPTRSSQRGTVLSLVVSFDQLHDTTVLHRLSPQRYAEATYALIQARCDRDTAIENHRLQLEQGRLQFEQDRLRFEIKRHEEKMKLREMELQQRQRSRRHNSS